jgi:hypothetical protein
MKVLFLRFELLERNLAAMWRLSRACARVPRLAKLGSLVVCLWLGAPRALAAPIEATGSAAQAQVEHARDQAIFAARRAALEQAISSIDVTVDPAAVQAVLARPEAWTAAYRVLEVAERSGRIEVRVEVEIDVPRLRKRIVQASASASAGAARGFRFSKLSNVGCSGVDQAAVETSLRAYDVIADRGDSSLSLTITCTDRGAVTHTHVRAAAVEIVAVTGCLADASDCAVARELRVSAQGFADQPAAGTSESPETGGREDQQLDAANAIALERALAELGDQLALDARGDIELRVEHPWPAARIGTLERSLRESVIGVDQVELAGIAADGSVLLRIGGRIDGKQLARSLQELTFPGFGLVGLHVDGAHALRVRLQ